MHCRAFVSSHNQRGTAKKWANTPLRDFVRNSNLILSIEMLCGAFGLFENI